MKFYMLNLDVLFKPFHANFETLVNTVNPHIGYR